MAPAISTNCVRIIGAGVSFVRTLLHSLARVVCVVAFPYPALRCFLSRINRRVGVVVFSSRIKGAHARLARQQAAPYIRREVARPARIITIFGHALLRPLRGPTKPGLTAASRWNRRMIALLRRSRRSRKTIDYGRCNASEARFALPHMPLSHGRMSPVTLDSVCRTLE